MKISTIILTLLCTIILFSCGRDSGDINWREEYVHDDNNITVHYAEDYSYPIDSLQLSVPAKQKHTLYIKGGDRNYTITRPKADLLDVTFEQGNVLVIEALKVGNVEILIMDGANHSYLLKVNMSYITKELVLTRTEVVIKGDGLTELEKDTIKEKALKTIPVKIDGGYRFTYTEFSETQRGVVRVYPKRFGESDNSMKEYSFEYIYFGNTAIKGEFIINIDGSNRVFRYGQSKLPTKSYHSDYYTYLMIEDVTEEFQTEYPSVEKVFAQQQLIDIKQEADYNR